MNTSPHPMIPARRPTRLAWLAVLLAALAFLAWLALARIASVEALTNRVGTIPAVEPGSVTGYAGGLRLLVAPGRNHESYQWIAQTQRMLAEEQWRLRQVSYDNAPLGRPAAGASLYRWWLGALSWVHHHATGEPIGRSVERVALAADPLLLMLFLVAGAALVAARVGALAAAGFTLVAVTLYPFGGSFLPGAPDDPGLSLALAALSGLMLMAGMLSPAGGNGGKKWWIASGLVGAIGLWVNVGVLVPFLAGLGLGGLGAALLTRSQPDPGHPWRSWAIAGAAGTLGTWLIEFAPDHLGLSAGRLTEVHPLYALAWLGLGEGLALTESWRREATPAQRRRDVLRLGGAIAAVAAIPLVMALGDAPGFLAKDTFAYRLTALSPEIQAPDFVSWLVSESRVVRIIAVLSPLLLLLPAGLLLAARTIPPDRRAAVSLATGPVIVAAGHAFFQLSWWNGVGAAALVLMVATWPAAAAAAPWVRWTTWVVPAALLSGSLLLVPRAEPAGDDTLSKAELVTLAEREIAHWLARRRGAEDVIALAPPNLTVSLFYHGGLRGLGTPYRENPDGFRASVRIAGASSADEAHALVQQRNLTHIIIPSWDEFLDEYARVGANQPEHSLMGLLHRWLPPRWLRPIPYYLPEVSQLAGERVTIFEVVDVQDPATSLSRLAEYFVDMGDLELARLAARALRTDYSADLGAWVAKARTELALRDGAGLGESMAAITGALKEGADDALEWDRRVSLTLVLAEANQVAPARAQAERCLDEMGEAELRALPEGTLFRFLTLCRALGLELADPELQDLARSLLPPALRDRI